MPTKLRAPGSAATVLQPDARCSAVGTRFSGLVLDGDLERRREVHLPFDVRGLLR
ncbi:MAG: hypothetical protein U5R14_14755 [Gemmatimonadota bacterium]|nr:hypothetical protein [Gemmatimonadota bacterium]